LIDLKTRACPFCGKEISDEAILCKFCHNLLIDENGKDVEPQVPQTESAEDNEKTIVYSKDELKKAMEQAAAASITSEEVVAEAEEKLEEEQQEDTDSAEETAYIEDKDDETQVYTDADTDSDGEENADTDGDEEDDDDEEYDEDEISDYDSKRTFIITAIITLGILIIVIAAVGIGTKLFGAGDDESSSAKTVSKASTSSVAAVVTETTEDSSEAYEPKVTDDTVSEDPEEIADSEASDPVVDSAVDSATDSSTDSSADSTADSSATDSIADTTESLAAPAGEYYSWNEAMQIWSNFVAANSLTDYGYSYGTDAVEMVFSAADASGNTNEYRVDLQTGAVSVVE
jgi:hypothetical protein